MGVVFSVLSDALATAIEDLATAIIASLSAAFT
jgi:hypothetical protein